MITTILTHPMVEIGIRILGLSVLAAAVTAIAAFVYRTRVRVQFPEGATVILGLGIVAIYLNTRLIFIQFIGDTGDPLTVEEAAVNVAVFVAAGMASYGGRTVGDRAALSDRISWGGLQPDFSPIVRATGRFITVTLPDEVGDIEGYDPVKDETKTGLSGHKLDFQRGLTLTELQSQLTAQLKEKYDIGYVDIELTAEGTVEYLAVGQRVAGIGPTLPPNAVAVAVRADPPFSSTPGDTVQLWRPDPEKPERIGIGELRATVGSVATIVTDEAIADRIDPKTEYRLLTLSADEHPEKEFAAMLRRGDETMSIVELGSTSPLLGSSIGAIDATVIAVQAAGGEVETIPKRERLIQAGDTLFVIGRPDTLRKLEAAKGSDPITDITDTAIAVGTPWAPGEAADPETPERKREREDWTQYDDPAE